MILGKTAKGSCAYLGGLPAVLEKFSWSWADMLLYSNEYMCGPSEYIHRLKATVSEHAQARTGLTRQFLGDWLLMVDADHAFEPDLCARLVGILEKYDLDVLSGIYTYKVPPYAPTLYDWDPVNEHFTVKTDWPGFNQPRDKDKPYFEIGCAGAGTLLVRRRVFLRIEQELKQGSFDTFGPWEEDFAFFRRCVMLGIKCHAATDVQSHHLEVNPLSLDNFDRAVMPQVAAGGAVA